MPSTFVAKFVAISDSRLLSSSYENPGLFDTISGILAFDSRRENMIFYGKPHECG